MTSACETCFGESREGDVIELKPECVGGGCVRVKESKGPLRFQMSCALLMGRSQVSENENAFGVFGKKARSAAGVPEWGGGRKGTWDGRAGPDLGRPAGPQNGMGFYSTYNGKRLESVRQRTGVIRALLRWKYVWEGWQAAASWK